MRLNIKRLAWTACMAGLPALAQFTPIAQPNAAYTGSTVLMPITVPDTTAVTSLTAGVNPLKVTFSATLTAATVPTSWATWNTPPAVESATPRVLTDVGANTLTLTMSQPVSKFGFEIEPNTFGVFSVTATFLNNASVLGSITQSINGNAGALLAAATSAPSITSVVITIDPAAGGFAIAQVRFALAPTAEDSPFQISYAGNLTSADAFIDITNSGANGASLAGPGFGGAAGNLCVNVYAFSPDEQLVSCCSCLITPNGLASLSVQNDLISNTLTGVRPNSLVVKLVATAAGPTFTGTSCTNSAALAASAGFPLATGMLAWGTTTHSSGAGFVTTENPFTPATLSAGELASINNRCTNIIGNGSTFGICRSCRAGGLGGKATQ